MTAPKSKPLHVLVTGVGGNLGAKAVQFLETQEWCHQITALYYPAKPIGAKAGKVTAYSADLTDPNGDWRDYLDGVDTVIHFAARNAVPDSDWQDACQSFDMTVNLGLVAATKGVARFINCSSNHAVGGYKDSPLSQTVRGGQMHEGLPPAPGTKWNDGTTDIDSTPYATSKLFSERFMAMLAAQSGGKLTAVSLRIGWAQPGDNNPQNISVSGSPTSKGATVAIGEEEARTLRWFRNMWLSNDDFERLILAAVLSEASDWPTPALVINGISDNADTDWSLAAARRYIGYDPQDDIYDHLSRNKSLT